MIGLCRRGRCRYARAGVHLFARADAPVACSGGVRPAVGTLQLTEKAAWIPRLGVYYSGRRRRLLALAILLTTSSRRRSFSPPGATSSATARVHDPDCWCSRPACRRAGGGRSLPVLPVVGVDAVPDVLVIGVWGGRGGATRTIKFVLFTMAGSALMLAGMIYLACATPRHTPSRSTSSRSTTCS